MHQPLELEVLADDLGFPEGPAFLPDGAVLVVDIEHATVVRVDGAGTTVVARTDGGPNGLALDSPTTAIVANNGGFLWAELEDGSRMPYDRATHTNEPPGFAGGWIERVDLGTGAVEVLHRTCVGRAFKGPNDLVLDAEGGVWFTDHGKGRHDTVDRGGLYYLPADGLAVREVVYPLLGANGVGLSPEGDRVYVAETHTGRLWAWDVTSRGSVGAGTCVAATPYAFDSLAVEADGRVAIGAIQAGIVVITPDGGELDVHPIPGDVTTNIAFGGPDGRRAAITCSRSGRLVETTWPRPGLVLPAAVP